MRFPTPYRSEEACSSECKDGENVRQSTEGYYKEKVAAKEREIEEASKKEQQAAHDKEEALKTSAEQKRALEEKELTEQERKEREQEKDRADAMAKEAAAREATAKTQKEAAVHAKEDFEKALKDVQNSGNKFLMDPDYDGPLSGNLMAYTAVISEASLERSMEIDRTLDFARFDARLEGLRASLEKEGIVDREMPSHH